jgi:hypothetical protein
VNDTEGRRPNRECARFRGESIGFLTAQIMVGSRRRGLARGAHNLPIVADKCVGQNAARWPQRFGRPSKLSSINRG